MPKLRTFLFASTLLLAQVCAPLLTTGLADGGANHQTRNTHFGVSGGNINDISRAFCCSGTLGSLVTDGTTQYILSNNHVLARSDKAVPGEEITQPGRIDNGCRVPPTVAQFTTAPPLGSNVDAAIAEMIPGAMDSTGFIEDIGTISSAVLSPSIGLAVAKSGRTTGFTTGTIGAINASINVQYQDGCGVGRKFVVSFTNQVVINSSSFSAGGDSGSLIVANNADHNAVALLYAGSSTTTIGNPIGEVLDKVGAALGRPVSFVGGGRGGGRPPRGSTTPSSIQPYIPSFGGQMPELPQQAVDNATRVLEQNRGDLMSRPSVLGVGVGLSDRSDLEAAIVIYVDKTTGIMPQLARSLDGVRVRIVLTDPIVAR